MKIKNYNSNKFFGLTGGIACGKSLCSKMFESLGAIIIDADKISRDLVTPSQNAYKKIVSSFGKQILVKNVSNSPIDRNKLRNIVFTDQNALDRLNKILEKKIFDNALERFILLSKKHPASIFIYDAATIFEAKVQDRLNEIIVVYIPEEMQLKRLIDRDSVSAKTAKNILKIQIPIEEKKKRADFIIDNSGSIENTRKQVFEIYENLKRL